MLTTGGLDFFPLEVHLDEKFELIEAEFGLIGFAVVVKLFQRIYGGQGYYCEWTDEVALLFAKNCGLGGNAVSEIVRAAIKRGIFDKGKFEKYGILTSFGIQKRYFEAVSRRKLVEVKKEYLLLSPAEKYKNVCILSENVNISGENVDILKQSKVKESKGKESKGEREDELSDFVKPTLSEVIAYCRERNSTVNAEQFFSHYSSNGWMVGANPMKDWKAAVILWEKREEEKAKSKAGNLKNGMPSYDLSAEAELAKERFGTLKGE